ncbi:triple tyrosine motif-containing protein [Muriicola sp. Z0-33]|uniref:helix-turn-helix and ligand-binding sensor domain-containing protein n=1 Tax=Muriicola sp. Z0-33 TaxID=2816957 RepID=UPI002237DC8E|nr:triple tyrosine motif-containing protein [Muriicola sp. Z0-33]MCW5517858.1 LuxR family transcriptional regulator [Muriicola sp. Z0-33]
MALYYIIVRWRSVALLLFSLMSVGVFSQELPPIQNFYPKDYHSENQNWAISQSDDKAIYIANNKGLLNFNGATWVLYPSPNETIMRSVKVVGERIYTGCYMEFGYWEKDDFGMLQYTSLSQKFSADLALDEEFWKILDIDDFMIFQSRNRIYIYSLTNDTIKIIDSETEIPGIFNLGQNIYFQEINVGIFKIVEGEALLVYDDDVVRNDEVVNILEKGDDLLVLTRHQGFYKASENVLQKWNIPSENLLSTVSVYSGLQLRDGNYALGTISHGLLILGPDGSLAYWIDEIKGLQNNTVLSLFEDMDQNAWLGLDNGISFVNLKSPFKVFHDNSGIVGSVYAAIIKDDILYLGSNQGLFYKKVKEDKDFKLIRGTQGQVWSLNSIGETLFVGHHSGTFIIDGERAIKIADIPGTWKIGAIPGTELLMQGNYSGLHILERDNGYWQLKNKIARFDHSARYFEVFGNDIFVNHEYKGIFKVTVDSTYTTAQTVSVDTTMIGANSGIVRYKDDLLYSYHNGIFKYDWNSDSFAKDSVLSVVYEEDNYVSGKLLVDNKDEYLWAHTEEKIYYISSGNLANIPTVRSIPLSESMLNSIAGYESITGLPEDGAYLIGNSSGYIVTNIEDTYEKEFVVHIADVRQAGKNLTKAEERILMPDQEGELANDENYLEISFNTPEYNKFLNPKYQYQLQGLYPQWSDWSEQSKAIFENLPQGDYVFNVRAKVGDLISTNVASYSFKISRPWYWSNVMLAIYFFIALLLSLIIHNSYKLYYQKRQKELMASNRRQLELVRMQNERSIINLKNKQLKEDFRNKSNELAAATMSILKKNQLLVQVKEQLMASDKNIDATKPLITIIDRNLKQNDDWELFKEAFNNADREFLKKLESVHPNLTPNDIRLCAYLRLNLSSKEIAELFSISARSVEIKRYRLRKKMNLVRDENLVNYILKL